MLEAFLHGDNKYSVEYLYFNLFVSRGELERMLEGLRKWAWIRAAIIEEFLDNQQRAEDEWERTEGLLKDFLKRLKRNKHRWETIRSAAIATESRIRSGYILEILKDIWERSPEAFDSAQVLDAVKMLDNLKLYIKQRGDLDLAFVLNLYNMEELEEEVRKGWDFLKGHLDTLMVFAPELYEQSRRFLILDSETYPWWFPDKKFS